MLELKNISKTFNAGTVNEKQAIDNLSLTLNDGDFVTVIGGNGAEPHGFGYVFLSVRRINAAMYLGIGFIFSSVRFI